jgi:hypothetical protein
MRPSGPARKNRQNPAQGLGRFPQLLRERVGRFPLGLTYMPHRRASQCATPAATLSSMNRPS